MAFPPPVWFFPYVNGQGVNFSLSVRDNFRCFNSPENTLPFPKNYNELAETYFIKSGQVAFLQAAHFSLFLHLWCMCWSNSNQPSSMTTMASFILCLIEQMVSWSTKRCISLELEGLPRELSPKNNHGASHLQVSTSYKPRCEINTTTACTIAPRNSGRIYDVS